MVQTLFNCCTRLLIRLFQYKCSESWHHYVPTWDEWAITSASLAGALLVITLYAPISNYFWGDGRKKIKKIRWRTNTTV
jgi:hypothetical protein